MDKWNYILIWYHLYILSKCLFIVIYYILEGQVNHVRVSPEGKFVFSAGEDGCVFVFAVT